MNRRVVLAGCSALVALSCVSGEQPEHNATLRLPLINDPILNPVIAPDIGSIMINKVIFPGLVRPDEQLRPTPDLALSWTASEDGLQYTFALRPGVRWHDGQRFTANDVKFTFDQILDVNSGSQLRSDFAPVERVDVIDSLTLRFTLRAPFAPFLSLLGYNAGIMPQHAFKGRKLADAVDFNRARPIGTGPFKVRESTPGSAIVLERNEQYHGDPPRLQRLVFKIVPDVNVQVAQLRAGELDVILVEPANLPSLERDRQITVREAPVVQHYYIGFNQRQAKFASPYVRRAFGYAVNRDAIIAGVLKGHGDAPVGTIPVALGDYFADSMKRLAFNRDSARTLLAKAGWRVGTDGRLRNDAGEPFRFTLFVDKGNPTREQAALAVQHDLQALGCEVTLRMIEFATLVRDHLLPGKFDAALTWWTTPPDPDQWAFYASGQDHNHVAFRNATADSLLTEGRATNDVVRRRAVYHAFQALERDDPPGLVLFYPRELIATRAGVRGFPRLGLRDALRHSERFFLGAPPTN
ncbi:MAG: ABC transporter substrate-binding protein [Gemmatimonadaceae bacterium]